MLHVLSPAHAGLDDEWDGYDMYDMEAGSGDEGRRRIAIDDIIAEAADPVSTRPVCSHAVLLTCVRADCTLTPACVRPHHPPSPPPPVL